MALNLEDIVNSVVADNLKAIAGKTAAVAAETFQDHAAHRKVLDQIMANNLMAWSKQIHEPDAVEAVATGKLLKGDATLPEQLSQFGSVIAQIQQVMKGAQTTVPETTGVAGLAGIIELLKTVKA